MLRRAASPLYLRTGLTGKSHGWTGNISMIGSGWTNRVADATIWDDQPNVMIDPMY
jgi:hypothetical protein